MLAYSDGMSFKRSKKPSYWRAQGGSTVNDIAHHFGCSRQTIHNLMNRYNRTGSVRVRASPGRARVAMLHPYRFKTSFHPCYHFDQQTLLLGVYGVHAQKIINHLCKIMDLAFFSMTMQGVTQCVNNHTIPCSK